MIAELTSCPAGGHRSAGADRSLSLLAWIHSAPRQYQSGPWNVVRRDAIQTGYKHAAENPDLYRACLSDARTRQAYLSTLSRYAEQNFGDRLNALNRQPRVPVPVMARAFVGAHVAILEAWLAGELQGDIEELASMALDLFVAGGAWAHGLRLDELGYSAGLPANAPQTGASNHKGKIAPS